jgi:hypothetical protein
MAQPPPIQIDKNGDVPTTPVHVHPGEMVYWQAADARQTWHIHFNSPFAGHVISTDPNDGGKSKQLKIRKLLGLYSYTVSSSDDPTLVETKNRILAGGGGIIIEN